MTHVLLFISLVGLSLQVLCAQNNLNSPFLLEGVVNADTGMVQLRLLADTSYYPLGGQTAMSAQVSKGEFSFRSHTPYPIGVMLSYGRQYRSSVFIIEPGLQSIICDIDSSGEAPVVSNAAMKEYEEQYKEAFKNVSQKRNQFKIRRDSLAQRYQNEIPAEMQLVLERELKSYYDEGDQILLQYVTAHPDSYLALWRFINLLGFGYEKIHSSIFARFSDSLKNTITGKVLTEKLKAASTLAIGENFPLVVAENIQGYSLERASLSGNKYTLIDFWYSNCGPCIVQFPHLKEMYKQYKNEGFEVIGISTDRSKYRGNWLKAIQKHQLPWPQYWDENGKEASRLSINKFPTNYLLDSKGKIIRKDMKPIELEQFLDHHGNTSKQ